RLTSAEQLAGEHELLRPPLAEDAWQPVHRAGPTEQRAPDVEVADLRVLGGDPEVRVDEDLEPARGRVTLDHRDRRRRATEDRVADPRRAKRDLVRLRGADELALELVEVEPRAERPLAATDDDHADVVVLLRALPRLVELGQELLADGVPLV